MWLAFRNKHQGEPGGPCRALLHDEQGVPAHTHSTAPEDIHPLTIWNTLGFNKSLWGPLRTSMDTTPQPCTRRRADNRSEPEKSSKTTACPACREFRAARRAARNCFRKAETIGSGLARHFTGGQAACGLPLWRAFSEAGDGMAPAMLEKGWRLQSCRSERLQSSPRRCEPERPGEGV